MDLADLAEGPAERDGKVVVESHVVVVVDFIGRVLDDTDLVAVTRPKGGNLKVVPGC